MQVNNKIAVLYVDDEAQNLRSFKANFRKIFNVITADDANEALAIIRESTIDVVVTDHMMPDISGVDLLEILKNEYPTIGRILITGCNDINVVIEAINRGEAFRFLTKPWVKDDLVETIIKCNEVNANIKVDEAKSVKLEQTNEQLEFMLRQKLIS